MRNSWERWHRGLENLLAASKVTKPVDKKSHLLAWGGFELQDVFYGIPGADVDESGNVDPYKVAVEKLNEYFAPKHHDAFSRYLFWSLAPEPEEPIEKFLLRAQKQALKCKFGTNENESRDISIIDKIVLWAPVELREKLLQKEDLTLDTVTNIVNAYQIVKFQSGQISKKEVSSNRIYGKSLQQNSNFSSTSFNCSRCGRHDHDASSNMCPAKNDKCHKCGSVGHYARRCQTRTNNKRSGMHLTGNNSRQNRSFETKRPKTSIRHVDTKDDDSGSDEYSVYNINEQDELVWCEVGGVSIEMLIDSGSTYNMIDDKTWKYMQRNNVTTTCERIEGNKRFLAYGKYPLNLLNVFEALIVIKDGKNIIKDIATFYVIENGQQPLLGKATARAMGLLILGLPSTHDQKVNSVQIKRSPFPKIKSVQIIIPVDPKVKPVQQSLRRCPIALVTKMREKIEELLATDIIEKVSQASGWVSPLVPVLKDNGDLRICVDMRRANLAIVRESHPLPTMDDLFARLVNSVYFSKLDMKNGFHQCELHPDSRHITTFISPWGLYRYKRLIFGVNCAPELFQKIMEWILSGCENTINYIDDIVVFGRTEEAHDMELSKVLRVLKKQGVLLNSQKCIFKKQKISFMGHSLSAAGIEPSTDKVDAIRRFRAPETKEELRSFLGLVTFVARFIPDLATITAPLRELQKKTVKFLWTNSCEKTFQKIKDLMSSTKALGYFNVKDRTLVVADASGVALGAVLIQFNSNQDPRIITFAAKSLSECEKRFSQTEKEALALVWAVERFKLYLLGIRFELETDHKPLEIIFGKNSRPCARIERWVLRLQAFNYTIVYRKGKANLADPLSRLPVQQNDDPFDENSEMFIREIVDAVCVLSVSNSCNTFDLDVEACVRAIHCSAAVDINEIEKATEADVELQDLKKCMQSGNWSSGSVKDYVHFKDEFGFTDNLILRNTKLVIPTSLRPRLLALSHEGHPGESLMKSRLRQRCWWPKMDKDVQKVVAKCSGCQLVALPERPEPMSRKPLPCKPWTDLALDYLGPMPSGESILVVIDYFSRYFEARIIPNQSAIVTRDCIDEMFTRLGFPFSLTFDNAKQLISNVMKEYCATHGIVWNNTIPYWPQANGEVERQNRSLMKRIKIGHQIHGDWKSELRSFLQMYYTTPHSVTQKTPTELMFGRTIRSKLPCIDDLMFTPASTDFRDSDKLAKSSGKEREDTKRRAKHRNLEIGDTVLMQNLKPEGKLSSTFNKDHYIIVKKNGPSIVVKNKETGREYERNSAHLKLIPSDDIVYSGSEEDFEGFQDSDVDAQNSLTTKDAIPTLLNTNECSSHQTTNTERPHREVAVPLRYRN